jgi:hypothetical protein
MFPQQQVYLSYEWRPPILRADKCGAKKRIAALHRAARRWDEAVLLSKEVSGLLQLR